MIFQQGQMEKERENEYVDNVLVIQVERWKCWQRKWRVKQMDRWMKCVLWASVRSFEKDKIKDVQLTRVKHKRFRRIVSHDCCHTKQTLWYSNLIDSLICCSQSRTLQNYGGWSSSFSPGLRENPMCWSSPALSHSPLSALDLRGELLTLTWTDSVV